MIKFQQDGFAQKLMLRALEENGDQYFRYMAARGWKLPQGFYVERIIHKREPTEGEILREEVQELRKQFAQLQTPKEQPKTSFIDSICALPFDRTLYMQPFPKDIEVPKYDKYDGNGDPHNHVKHFYAIGMDFMHEDTYLMRLFPRNFRGQAM